MLNGLFPRGADNVAAAEALQGYAGAWQYLDTPIGTRKVFSHAFGGGMTVRGTPRKIAKPSPRCVRCTPRFLRNGGPMALQTQKPPPILTPTCRRLWRRGPKRRNVSHQDQIVLRLPPELRQAIDTSRAKRRAKSPETNGFLRQLSSASRPKNDDHRAPTPARHRAAPGAPTPPTS